MYEYVDLLTYLFFLACLIYGICVGSGVGNEEGSMELWVLLGIIGVIAYPVALEMLAHLIGLTQRAMGHHLIPPDVTGFHGPPIVYCTRYNITACGLEKVHPFDSTKYGRSGYHHCSGRSGGGGFCVYADITLVVHLLRLWYPHKVRRVAIVDLVLVTQDAHQGNGHERDFLQDKEVFIIDFYNPMIYPGDEFAKNAIRHSEFLSSDTSDSQYCRALESALERMFTLFQPDLVVYNAGTDCMEGDPLGGLSITPTGILQRDEIVFREAISRKVPIVMLLSGGYQKSNAPAIASSIENILQKFR